MENSNQSVYSRPNLPGPFDLLEQSVAFYKKHFATIIGILAIPTLFVMLSWITSGALSNILSLLGAIIGLIANLGLIYLLTREDAPTDVPGTYKTVISGILSLIWIAILINLVNIGGFILFVIPGLILSLLTSFSLYLYFAEGEKGIRALAKSWFYVKGYWWAIFGRALFIGFSIFIVTIALSIIFIGLDQTFNSSYGMQNPVSTMQIILYVVNSLFLYPFFILYFYFIYKGARSVKNTDDFASDEPRIRKNIKIFAILGIVAFIAMIALFSYAIVYTVKNNLNGPDYGASVGSTEFFRNLLRK